MAIPIAKNVSRAATRSVPECNASEMRPRLPLARPVPSFSASSAAAATTEVSAVRRCGLIADSETEEPAEAGSSSYRAEPPLPIGDVTVEGLGAVPAAVGPVVEQQALGGRAVLEVELAVREARLEAGERIRGSRAEERVQEHVREAAVRGARRSPVERERAGERPRQEPVELPGHAGPDARTVARGL